MSPTGTAYPIVSDSAGRVILQAIETRFRVRRELRSLLPMAWWDTFDWRLLRDGGALSVRSGEHGWDLAWVTLTGKVRDGLRVESSPGFAWDLPEGRFREELEAVIGVRRLLPLVKIECLQESLLLLGSQDRLIGRVDLEEATACAPDDSGSQSSLPPRIRLQPMDASPAEFEQVTTFLEAEFGLRQDPAEPFLTALEAIGRQPGDYSSKLNVTLQPWMRADRAAKEILRALLRTIRANEDGTRHGLDTEFLHDLRVAVRRTRTCLTQIQGVFPEGVVERFRRDFRWLGSVTGPTRDLDVYLLGMGDYRGLLPEAVHDDLEPLIGHLERCHRVEHARLVEALDSDLYRDLLEAWGRFLEEREPDGTALPNARRPISEVATERIARRWKRVIKLGRGIGDATPAESFHRMRIECKKLRYLLEFFRSIYSPAELGAIVRELKRLQDNLGEFHDLQVQQDSLSRFA